MNGNGFGNSILGLGLVLGLGIVLGMGVARAAPPAAPSAKGDPVAGGEVYNETCVECHGQDGRGAVPGAPDFTKTDGVAAKADRVLLGHILKGFKSPGSPTPMPPNGDNDALTIKDIRNVLAYLHEYYQYKTFARAGQDVYEQSCAGCHGDEGTGAFSGVPDLTGESGPLSLPDKVLIEHILNGYSSGTAAMPMPPKGGDEDLTLRQVWEVLGYLHQRFHYGVF